MLTLLKVCIIIMGKPARYCSDYFCVLLREKGSRFVLCLVFPASSCVCPRVMARPIRDIVMRIMPEKRGADWRPESRWLDNDTDRHTIRARID